MERYNNLYVLGTSHIATESIDEVSSIIKSLKPEIICLELDSKRLKSLFSKEHKLSFADLRHLGPKAFAINYIAAWIEKKLGKIVGTTPGSEMKAAFLLAKEYNSQVLLIDQDITITLKRLKKAITLSVVWKFIIDILKGIFLKKKEIEPFDLKKVPPKATIKKLLKQVKERYPSIYKAIVEERNDVMAKNLKDTINNNPGKKIVAILGAGHEQEIINLVKQYRK